MKYSKLFEELSEHEDYIVSEDYILPYASYIRETDTVKYNQYGDDFDPEELEYMNFLCANGVLLKICLNSYHTLVLSNNVDMWYSFDKVNWSRLTTTLVILEAGKTMYLKGNNPNGLGCLEFSYSGDIDDSAVNALFGIIALSGENLIVNGNIMSLVYGDNFKGLYEIPADYCFAGLFYGHSFYTFHDIIKVPLLPAKILKPYCYAGMFAGTNLMYPPKLPATTLANGCYRSMFRNCPSLTIYPELLAMTMKNECYLEMFKYCTSLTTTPDLPATTLALSCYQGMFYSCTSLTTSPELPATTLANYCYETMFCNCTSLTTTPTELPATTLANHCYDSMFAGCTSLTTSPELPATTLVGHCYDCMFLGCSNLNYIKAMFITEPSNLYTYNWVNGVSSTGTFVKNSAATWNVTGVNGIPTGWTVETATA